MSPVTRTITAVMLAGLPLLGARASAAWAQAPTLPSDTLEANYAPASALAPMPEKAPSLPSDTIRIGAPLEGYDPAVSDSLNPGPAPDDTIEDPTSRSQY